MQIKSLDNYVICWPTMNNDEDNAGQDFPSQDSSQNLLETKDNDSPASEEQKLLPQESPRPPEKHDEIKEDVSSRILEEMVGVDPSIFHSKLESKREDTHKHVPKSKCNISDILNKV